MCVCREVGLPLISNLLPRVTRGSASPARLSASRDSLASERCSTWQGGAGRHRPAAGRTDEVPQVAGAVRTYSYYVMLGARAAIALIGYESSPRRLLSVYRSAT